MALKKASEIQGGGSFFKPNEYQSAHLLMIEPKVLRRDVPNDYKGVVRNRDEVTADVTVFQSQADLDNGRGSEVKGVTLTHPGIVNKVKNNLGDAIAGRVGEKMFDRGMGWILDVDSVSDVEFDLVAAFYEKREAAIKAALADAPDFD